VGDGEHPFGGTGLSLGPFRVGMTNIVSPQHEAIELQRLADVGKAVRYGSVDRIGSRHGEACREVGN
jgi:hypothetical protein